MTVLIHSTLGSVSNKWQQIDKIEQSPNNGYYNLYRGKKIVVQYAISSTLRLEVV